MPIDKGTEFTIELERTENVRYGWQIHFTDDKAGIMVEALYEGGLIDMWNKQHADLRVEPGDVIIEVNGSKREDMKIHLGLEAAKETGPIKFVIMKGCADDVPLPKPETPKLSEVLGSFELSNFAPLLVMSYKGKLDALDEAHQMAVVIIFFTIIAVRSAILLRELFMIQSVPANGVIDIDPVVWFGKEVVPSSQANPRAYDMSLWKDFAKELLLGGFVVFMMYYYNYGGIAFMAMHSIRICLKTFESPLFKVHILGRTLARPYGAKPLEWKKLQAHQAAKKQE